MLPFSEITPGVEVNWPPVTVSIRFPSGVKVLTVKYPLGLVLEGVVINVNSTHVKLTDVYAVYPFVIWIVLPEIVLVNVIFWTPNLPITVIVEENVKSVGSVIYIK